MTNKFKLAMLSVICSIVSMGLLIYVDWRIALGVYVFTFANNLVITKEN